jgi:hypothetical protein
MSTPTRVFVGRAREQAELEAGLDDARDGRGGLYLVGGEPGIGKTRLAEELARRASERGFVAVWGRCWEAGGAPAFWPWIQVLRALARGSGRASFAGETREALSRILPELGVPAHGAASDAAHERFRMFDAVAEAVRRASDAAPLLVVLDDLHAADPSSLALLHFFARELRDARLFVLGTYRDREARQDPERAEVMSRIAREGTYFPLARFSEGDVRALVAARSPATDPAAVAAVFGTTEGHPLFVDEVLRAFAQGRGLDGSGRLLVPDTVRDAIRARIDRLDAATRAVAEVAAVLGREVDAVTVARVLDEDDRVVRESLRAATAVGVIVDRDGGTLGFSHALVRDALYRGVEPERRARLHACAASVIASGGAPDESRDEVALHLLEAGPAVDATVALDAVTVAAARAMGACAFEDAVSILSRGVQALAPRLADPRALAEMLVALIEAETRSRRDATETCARAARLAREAGAPELLARAALALGVEFVPAVVNETLVTLLREAAGALPREPSALRARVLARLASALQPANDPHEPMAIAREAITMARGLDDRETLRAVLMAASAAFVDYAPAGERAAIDREALSLAEEAGDAAAAIRAQIRLFVDLMELGKPALAEGAAAGVERLAERLRRPGDRWYARMLRASLAAYRGAWERAAALASEARRAVAKGDGAMSSFDAMHAFAVALARHDDATLAEQYAGFAESFQTIAWPFDDLFTTLIAVRGGNVGRARDFLERLPPDSPVVRFEHVGMHAVAELRFVADYGVGAEVLLEELERRRGAFMSYGVVGLAFLGPIERAIACVASVTGRWAEAERDFERALARCRDVGARPAEAQVLLDYGTALVRRGERDKGRASLSQAEALAGEIDMPGLARRARERAAEYVAAPGSGSAAPWRAPGAADVAFTLAREGDVWRVARAGVEFRVKDSRGMQMLAALVAEPGREMHALALGAGGDPGELGDAGLVLDARAAGAYKARLADLRDEERDAERDSDRGRLARARAEIDALAAELSAGLGLGGRGRKVAAATERARSNVQRRIKDAVRRIEEHDADLGRYLGWAVRTGTFCVFDPTARKR